MGKGHSPLTIDKSTALIQSNVTNITVEKKHFQQQDKLETLLVKCQSFQ